MADKYHNLDDDEKETSISDGPALNEVPRTTVNQGLICGVFKKPRWCRDGFKVLVIGAIIFSASVAIALIIDISLRSHNKSTEVVTDDDQCTRLVKDLFESTEANAVDGAVAGMLCLAVTRPDQVSLAGGGFMVYHSKEKSGTIDFQFAATSKEKTSRPVALPGLLPGLMQAHRLYGKIEWSRILQSCISLAKYGFAVCKHLAHNIKQYQNDLSPEMKKMFSYPNGTLLEEGDTMKMDKLATILADLSKQDLSTYESEFMKVMTDWSHRNFQDYVVRNGVPLTLQVDKLKLVTSSLPSAGISALVTLEVLRRILPQSTLLKRYHGLAETLKVVLENQTYILEEPFKQNMSHEEVVNHIDKVLSSKSSDELADKIKNIITSDVKRDTATGNQPKKHEMSTAKVLVIDHDGEAVAMTSSLGHIFGAKEVTDSGIVLNNGLDMFPDGWKLNNTNNHRPISYSAPIIGFRRKSRKEAERFAFAASSDRKGLVALCQVLNNIFYSNMGVSLKTINKTRLFFDVEMGELSYEGDRETSDQVRFLSSKLSRFYGPSIKEVLKPIGRVFVVKRGEKSGNSFRDTRDL